MAEFNHILPWKYNFQLKGFKQLVLNVTGITKGIWIAYKVFLKKVYITVKFINLNLLQNNFWASHQGEMFSENYFNEKYFKKTLEKRELRVII